MGETPSRDQRKAMLRAHKEREHAAFEDGLPVPVADLAALFDHLDAQLGDGECDGTLGMTTAFLVQRGLDAARVTEWLHAAGGHCDCEVLANVADQREEWS